MFQEFIGTIIHAGFLPKSKIKGGREGNYIELGTSFNMKLNHLLKKYMVTLASLDDNAREVKSWQQLVKHRSTREE
jgi:hypothetical protein